jgi:hypothetical protein
MPTTLEDLLEQVARCRRLAAHVLDKDLQKRLLDLAEEYERKVAERPRGDPDVRLTSQGDRVPSARVPRTAEDPSRITEDLENETAEP